MLDLRQIHSLTDFQRNTKQYVTQLQESTKPVILTINGEAALVIQDANSYQKLLDELEIARSIAAIKQSMQEFEQGEGQDARKALTELGEELGI